VSDRVCLIGVAISFEKNFYQFRFTLLLSSRLIGPSAYPKAEAKKSLESPKESPPPSPRENQIPPLSMGEQPQPERKIGELCTSDIIYLPILNLAKIGRPFEIKTSTIRMVQYSPFTGKYDPNLHLQVFV
jgi:hypothetical protein